MLESESGQGRVLNLQLHTAACEVNVYTHLYDPNLSQTCSHYSDYRVWGSWDRQARYRLTKLCVCVCVCTIHSSTRMTYGLQQQSANIKNSHYRFYRFCSIIICSCHSDYPLAFHRFHTWILRFPPLLCFYRKTCRWNLTITFPH